MDPPRSDTALTIKKIKLASVNVKMITGDHLNIAKELARQVDLGVNIYSNAVLSPASAERDDLIATADGFAQVPLATARPPPRPTHTPQVMPKLALPLFR